MSLKALIFDLDGTAIPNSPQGMPSQKVIQAVSLAKEKVKVACATGREVGIAYPIIDAFQFTSPCIVAGGSQIIDPVTKTSIWQRMLTADKIKEIVTACPDVTYLMGAVSDSGPEKPVNKYDYFFDKPIVYIMNVHMADAKKITKQLEHIQDISVLLVKAWIAGDVDIHITHKEASKKHALQEWLQIEEVLPQEVLVVGDSGNDMPLFEIGGIKVAMGNGAEELKAQADWVAPPQQEDGLATAIERFIF